MKRNIFQSLIMDLEMTACQTMIPMTATAATAVNAAIAATVIVVIVMTTMMVVLTLTMLTAKNNVMPLTLTQETNLKSSPLIRMHVPALSTDSVEDSAQLTNQDSTHLSSVNASVKKIINRYSIMTLMIIANQLTTAVVTITIVDAVITILDAVIITVGATE